MSIFESDLGGTDERCITRLIAAAPLPDKTPSPTDKVNNAEDLVEDRSALRITCGKCAHGHTLSGFDVATEYGTAEFIALRRRFAEQPASFLAVN